MTCAVTWFRLDPDLCGLWIPAVFKLKPLPLHRAALQHFKHFMYIDRQLIFYGSFLLPCALLKSARYQLLIMGIVDGSAENFRNVIITVSFRLFFITIKQEFFDFVESLQQTKVQDKMLQNLRPFLDPKMPTFHVCPLFSP